MSANTATEARTFRDNIAVNPLKACNACLLNRELEGGGCPSDLHASAETYECIRPNVPGTHREGPGAGPENMGINLFAQHRHDNQKLGASWSSVDKLVHYCRFRDDRKRPSATRVVLDVVGKMTIATSKAVASTALATTRATFRGLTIVLPDVGQFTIDAFSFAAIATSSIITGTGSLAVATVNAACTTVARGAVKAVEKGAVKATEKGVANFAKWALGAGLAVGAYFAHERAQDGHHGQAVLVALGAASVVPVVGTAASMAIDGANFLFDVFEVNF